MIKLESKTLMLVLNSDVQVGPLKATLVAQVFDEDIEFVDVLNVTYNGVPVSNWRKFVEMNEEFGIDYDAILSDEFDKIFTEEAIKGIVKGL